MRPVGPTTPHHTPKSTLTPTYRHPTQLYANTHTDAHTYNRSPRAPPPNTHAPAQLPMVYAGVGVGYGSGKRCVASVCVGVRVSVDVDMGVDMGVKWLCVCVCVK